MQRRLPLVILEINEHWTSSQDDAGRSDQLVLRAEMKQRLATNVLDAEICVWMPKQVV